MLIPDRLKTATIRYLEKRKAFRKGPLVKPRDLVRTWKIFKGDEVCVF